jgi:hypothetical protein
VTVHTRQKIQGNNLFSTTVKKPAEWRSATVEKPGILHFAMAPTARLSADPQVLGTLPKENSSRCCEYTPYMGEAGKGANEGGNSFSPENPPGNTSIYK